MPPATPCARAPALYIVDTDAAVRDGLSRLVKSAGFEPKPCNNAEAFVQQVADSNAACALLDLSDIGLDDPVVRARLRILATLLPVVALSVRDDANTERTARELGAQAFFRKPVDAAALLDAIRWVMAENK